MYKPNGKTITINDHFDAAEVMMRNGWTIDEPEGKAPQKEKTIKINVKK